MASKDRGKIKIIGYVACVVSLLALVLFLVLDIIVVKTPTDPSYSGIKVIFGYESKSLIPVKYLKFSFMCLLSAIMMLTGCGVSLYGTFKSNKHCSLIGALILVVSAILTFMTPAFVIFDNGYQLLGPDVVLSGLGWIVALLLIISAIGNAYSYIKE